MEETHVLEINLISAQGPKGPTGKLRRLQTYASVWVDSSNKLRTRIDRIGAENPIWNDKLVFQVSPDFLSSETSGVSIEIYAVGYLRDHLIGTDLIMEKFTKEISAVEVRTTEENRIRYSSKQIKHLPLGTITEFDWKDYCPLGFRLIQELEDIDHDDYLHTICNDETLNKLSSGKIGNVFHISNDDRFLIKILRKSEIKVILDMLPGYYRHLHNYRSSLFSTIYGAHAVKPIGGVKTAYFAVMSNMLHSTVFMNKLYDLKGSPKGRTNKKIALRNTTVLKDIDLDFCFYVNPLVRQRIIKQTKLDCEFLEAQGIMDYSLLVGLQSKGSCQGSLDGLNPVYGSFTPPCSFKSDSVKSLKTAPNSPDRSSVTMYSCSPDKDSVQSENSMTSNSTSSDTIQIDRKSKLAATLNDLFHNSSSTNFGMKIPARARRVQRATGEEEWYDVVLYLRIVDTFQDYGMKKRIEHCYKSIQHNSNSISTVHPKIYSSRFQDFVSNIFLSHDDDLSL